MADTKTMTTKKESDPAPKTGASPEPVAGSENARTATAGEPVDYSQRIRELEQENARLRETSKNSPAPAQPAPTAGQASDAVRELQRRAARQDLVEELGISRQQAEAVLDVMDSNPTLSPVEAKSLAAMRKADLFKGSEDDGFDARTHAAARPGVAIPAPKVEVDPMDDRLRKINAMPSQRRKDQYLNNLIGSIAAEDLGKTGHQLLPL